MEFGRKKKDRMKHSKQNQPTMEPLTWREQLGIRIRTPEERRRVASQLGVNPLTLTRWVNNESSPHKRSLQKLLTLLPSYETELTTEVVVFEAGIEPVTEERTRILLPLYTNVMNAYTTTHPTLLFWSISRLILQHALQHVVTQRGNVEIIVAQCMPAARTGQVRTLREILRESSGGVQDGPIQHWSTFFGAESLAGAAVTSLHTKMVYDFSEERSIHPRMLDIGEECSSIACPILYTNQIAGCLIVSSTVSNYFSAWQQQLIQSYAELFALAFSHEQFHPFESIALLPVPDKQEQQAHIASFRKRVSLAIKDAGIMQPLTLKQAEQRVWQQIEEELLLQS